MSVEEISSLHQTYIRLSDRFKAMWTFHQYLQGVHKALLGTLPRSATDFQKLYERVRDVSGLLSSSDTTRVRTTIAQIQKDLETASNELAASDRTLSPSLLRRFFERVKTQDDKILYNLIKFYLYSGDAAGESLDKLDFLFTRLAERYDTVAERFEVRQRGELIRLLEGFINLRPDPVSFSQPEVEAARSRVAELTDAVRRAQSFDALAEKGVLDRIRSLKRGLGAAYFHPQVLADTIELSIATKNRFQSLFGEEEERLMESSQRVAELEQGIAADPRLASAEVREELERFRRFKDAFDKGRENLNLKHEEITSLKSSIVDILAKFESALEPETESMMDSFGMSEPAAAASSLFAPDSLLSGMVSKIVSTVELVEEGTATGRQMYTKELVNLRLEPWEIGSVKRIQAGDEPPDPQTGELWKLYVFSAALRIRMDEEAKKLLELADARKGLDEGILCAAKSLARAKEYDEKFQWFIDEALYSGLGNQLSELYRSKFRLMRAFSGLWLLYNKLSGRVPGV